MASVRTAATAENDNPEWLKLIWACNEIDPTTFLKPELKEWWAGGTVEEYPAARVIHRGDGSVSVVSKTEHGADVLTAAAKTLGLMVN